MSQPARLPKATDNRFWTLFFHAFRLRCVVCKEGRVYRGWFGVEPRCPNCGAEVERGAGFLLGSIYFNSGLTFFSELIFFLIGYFVLGITQGVLLPILLAFALVFPLWFLRYARASFCVFDQYFNPRLPTKDAP